MKIKKASNESNVHKVCLLRKKYIHNKPTNRGIIMEEYTRFFGLVHYCKVYYGERTTYEDGSTILEEYIQHIRRSKVTIVPDEF